jgi:hypothetical protein
MISILTAAVVFLFILSISFLFYRAVNSGNGAIYLNPFAYTLLFSCFYILLPSFFKLNHFFSYLNVDYSYTIEEAFIGLYFVLVYFLFFVIYSPENKFEFRVSDECRPKPIFYFYLAIIILCCAYIVVKIPGLYYSTRGLETRTELVKVYYDLITNTKTLMFIWIMTIYVMFISISKKRNRYLIFLIPLFVIDFLTHGRALMWIALISIISVLTFNGVKIKIKYMISLFAFMIFISIARQLINDNVVFNLQSSFINGFGEFLYTSEVGSLLLSKKYYFPEASPVGHFVCSMFPSVVCSTLLSESFTTYSHYLSSLYDSPFGLASSMIAESVAYNKYMWLIYPWLLCFTNFISCLFLNSRKTSFIVINSLNIISIYSYFRGNYFSQLPLIFYFVFFFMYPIFILSLYRRGSRA